MKENPQPNIVHNQAENRFELSVDGSLAVLEYSLAGNTIIMNHTEVPPELEGRGLGSRLARAGLDHAREKGLKVVPLCTFVASFIERHPEYQNLLKKPD